MVHFDQHFLVNDSILRKIAKSINTKGHILEIGAGHGELTKLLPKDLTIIEIDKDLIPDLKENFPKADIINANAISELSKHWDYDIILSNVPYSICEPLFLILVKNEWKKAVLTVPKRFAEKLDSPSKIGIISNALLKITELCEVSREDFSPRAKTDSVVIILTPKTSKRSDLIRHFLRRDKLFVKNALVHAFTSIGLTKRQSREKIADLPYLNLRVFSLSASQLENLLNSL